MNRGRRVDASSCPPQPGADVEKITDEELQREVMTSVGERGRLGEQVRFMMSVSMLAEGWDAITVAHILGSALCAASRPASRSWATACTGAQGRHRRRDVGVAERYFVAPVRQTGDGKIAVKVINGYGDEVRKVFVGV
jgi:hypothetical protein